MQPKRCDTVHVMPWEARPESGVPTCPEAVRCPLQPVQPNPCLDELHAGHHSPDIPGHGGIPQRQLKAIQLTPIAETGLKVFIRPGLNSMLAGPYL
jgi:hypothetical protein